MKGIKLLTPLKYIHSVVAIPTAERAIPVETFFWNGYPGSALTYPDRGKDSGRLGYINEEISQMFGFTPQPVSLRVLSHQKTLAPFAIDDWRFVPVTHGDIPHLKNEWYDYVRTVPLLPQCAPPLDGDKQKNAYVHLAIATYKGRARELPWEMFRYDSCGLLVKPQDVEGDTLLYIIKPGERQVRFTPERWRSFQWELEPTEATNLPGEVRRKLI